MDAVDARAPDGPGAAAASDERDRTLATDAGPRVIARRRVVLRSGHAEVAHVVFDGKDTGTYRVDSGGCGLALLAVTSGTLSVRHGSADAVVHAGEWAISTNGEVEASPLRNTSAEAVSWREGRGCKPTVGHLGIEAAASVPLTMPKADPKLLVWPVVRGEPFGAIVTSSGRVEEHVHADSVEVLVVVEGSGALDAEGVRTRLGRGEVAVIPAKKRHSWQSDSVSAFRCVLFFEPGAPGDAFEPSAVR